MYNNDKKLTNKGKNNNSLEDRLCNLYGQCVKKTCNITNLYMVTLFGLDCLKGQAK